LDYIIDNVHHSGGISPGQRLMQKSFEFSGEDSKSAWGKGIDEMIKAYLLDKISHFSGKILITGGGQKFIDIQCEAIDYHENLVIEGLKSLEY
jgi:pantothenate kinase type III